MTAQEIRKKYIDFMVKNGHKKIPRALLIPQNDPTTLFTGSGMQPLISYLLGESHPDGKRLVDSQTCFRAEDMDEVGDNRHTTFFEMLGNWSLGDYFKEEQIKWFWEFLTNELKLDPQRIFVTCCSGFDEFEIPKDSESAEIWKKLFSEKNIDPVEVDIGSEENGYKVGEQGGRIFYYNKKNWWSRTGDPSKMPAGEPGGPDTEIFYLFPNITHDNSWGELCHPNCDCGRYIELGNSVFMEYLRTEDGFVALPNKNVDYGGGLERMAAAVLENPDVFEISLLRPIIEGLEELSGKNYQDHKKSMRVIADHVRAAVFLIADGAVPSNKMQGYVLRRLLRRAILEARDLHIGNELAEKIPKIVVELYKADYPELEHQESEITSQITKEVNLFKKTLEKGHLRFIKQLKTDRQINGAFIFELHDTYGFPPELTMVLVARHGAAVSENWQEDYQKLLEQQRERSRTAAQGLFKGGLADHSDQVIKYHTATHLMYQALRNVLGEGVIQRGSNITAERIRFDFSHPEKVTREQLDEVETIVNEIITQDLPVSWKEEPTQEALKSASGAFGDKYGAMVKVYTIGPEGASFSREICGGPHVKHTGIIGEGGKKFKIVKEESSSAGVRRIKAVLE